jgi:hypothetical protein
MSGTKLLESDVLIQCDVIHERSTFSKILHRSAVVITVFISIQGHQDYEIFIDFWFDIVQVRLKACRGQKQLALNNNA